MIECNTLAYNYWIDSFWEYWRYIDYNLSGAIGGITSLRPVGVRTPIDTSMVAMLELLTLLQLSDRNDVLIVHTFSIRALIGTIKPKGRSHRIHHPYYSSGL